ncbi:MAG: hypothetical protein ABI703_12220 [Gemmatimonadales bacterium]
MLLPLLCLLQSAAPDTLSVRSIERPPAPGAVIDSIHYGPPQLQLRTRQGVARIWFLRASDTFFVAATIPDSTRYWGDDFVLSLDTKGDGGDSPRHDDFQLYFRRVLDSSVVFRGRLGRWEPPKGDPDWRLGADRSGGGWEVSARDGADGWNLLVRLDPVWLEGAEGRLPRLAVRIFDNDPQGWFAWPLPRGTPQASSVERIPDLWAAVR